MVGVKLGAKRKEPSPAVIPCQSAPGAHEGFYPGTVLPAQDKPLGPSLVQTKEGHTTGQTPTSQCFFFIPSPPKVLCQDSLEAQQVLLVPALSAEQLLFFCADNLHSV